jgi:hypothetical protein
MTKVFTENRERLTVRVAMDWSRGSELKEARCEVKSPSVVIGRSADD